MAPSTIILIAMSRHQRIWIWTISLSVLFVAICIVGPLPQRLAWRHTLESAYLLRPLVAADSRFARVHVIVDAPGRCRVDVVGKVRTDSDLEALKRLLEQAHPPLKPKINVTVSPWNRVLLPILLFGK